MAKLLIEHGADVNARMPDGKTPLMFAAMFNQLDVIELLISTAQTHLCRRRTAQPRKASRKQWAQMPQIRSSKNYPKVENIFSRGLRGLNQ